MRQWLSSCAIALLYLNVRQAVAQVLPPATVWLPPNPDSGYAPNANDQNIPNAQWTTLLGNSIYFYDEQRSGKLSALEKERVPWRNDSCLDDGQDVDLDLSGGYYDAGNYIKATLPLSFTLNQLAWSGIAHGKAYDLVNQSAYLDNVLRGGLDWLIKCHPDDNTLYVLVGSANPNDAYWGGDRNIPTPRPSYAVTADKPGADVTASASAAFAAAAYLYSGHQSTLLANDSSFSNALRNATYSAVLLEHAQSLYNFSRNASQVVYQTSVPEINDAYPSSGFLDDQIYAALWLHIATTNASTSESLYLKEAESLYAGSNFAGRNGVFNWDSRIPALAYLMSLFSTNGSYSAEVSRYFGGIQNAPHTPRNSNAPFYTSGGLLYYSADSRSASLNPAFNMASLVYLMPNASGDAIRVADKQFNYILGRNTMNMPYIVGVHPSSPKNPHSALASAGNDITKINTQPEEEAYILYGAVVGGPSQDDLFNDRRSNYIQSEASLDYNAPLVVASAYKVLTDRSDPFYVTLNPSAEHGLARQWSAGQIAGCAIGCAAAVILLLAACTYWQRGRIARDSRKAPRKGDAKL